MRSSIAALRVVLFTVVACCFIGRNVVRCQQYDILDLGTLGGEESGATDINDLGQVIGVAETEKNPAQKGPYESFLWDKSSRMMVGLGVYGSSAINNNGHIVGGYWAGSYIIKNGQLEILNLGNLFGENNRAVDINEVDQIVGDSAIAQNVQKVWLFEEGKPITDIGTLGGSRPWVTKINNLGQVTGASTLNNAVNSIWHAYLWEKGIGMRDLGTLGHNYSSGYSINDDGTIVGESNVTANDYRAFIWRKDTGMIDASDKMPGSGLNLSRPMDINNHNQIVGIKFSGQRSDAFTWDERLGFMILPSLEGGNTGARAINEMGEIVGYSTTRDGYSHACLWVPRPTCSPDAEIYDEMQSELSHDIEIFGLGRVCTADLAGVLGVKRYLPYLDTQTGLRTIDTKITKLELTGTDPTCGEIKISLQPGRASNGKVVEKTAGTCFPADSFFDVYIQVQIPGQKLLANCETAKMRCVVSDLPPIGCTYQLGAGFDVPLYDAPAVAGQVPNLDCQSPGNPLGQISAADHQPTAAPVPPVVIPPQERTQLHIFAASQNQWLPLTEQIRKDYFKPALPVIIIVHGFNIDLLNNIDPWENDLAAALNARKPNGFNILAWDWMEESKGGTADIKLLNRIQNAANNINDQASKLTRTLQQLFRTSGFTGRPMHLMGHSLGTFLATFAALHLQNPGFGGGNYPVANLTLWDPPEHVPIPVIGWWRVPNSLRDNVPVLRLAHGTTVDVYSGSLNDRCYFANVWYAVPGWLWDPGLGHDTFNWYQAHTARTTEPTLHTRLQCSDARLSSTIGFGSSRTHAPASRELRFACQDQELGVSLVAHSRYRTCQPTDELVYAQYCIADALPPPPPPTITVRFTNGIGNGLCNCERPDDLHLRMRLRRPAGGGQFDEAAAATEAGQGEGGQAEMTATFTLPLTIATSMDYLQFTYRFDAAPAAADLTLSVQSGTETVPQFQATSGVELGEGNRLSPLLDLTPYRGKAVKLIFALSSVEPDAAVEISNPMLVQSAFHSNVAPVANAGASRAVEAAGATTPVTLNASASRDGNNDPLTFVWTLPQEDDSQQLGIAALGATPTFSLPLGGYPFTLFVRDPFDGIAEPEDIVIEVEYRFRRGDSDADGQINITDPIVTLAHLFLDPTQQICKDAADANDDDALNITDPVFALEFLFLGRAALPQPHPGVGLDPTPDLLGCDLPQH